MTNCDRCGEEIKTIIEVFKVFEIFITCEGCYKKVMFELKGEDYEKTQ